MGENVETKLIELFTTKIEEMRTQFDQERIRMRKAMNGFLIGFGVAILIFVFSAGAIVQKVNSLEQNYYKVAEKVEMLYLVAVQKGDIDPVGNPRGHLNETEDIKNN